MLDVVRLQRLAQQRVVFQVDHPHRQVVARPPVGVDQVQLRIGERSVTRRSGCATVSIHDCPLNSCRRAAARGRTIERGCTRYVLAAIGVAVSQAWMSSGEASAVSRQRRQVCGLSPCSRRHLECQRLPVRVQHAVQPEAAADAFQCERQRVRVVTPVGAIECHAVPLDACAVEHLVERQCGAICNHITPLAERNQLLDESMNVSDVDRAGSSRTS